LEGGRGLFEMEFSFGSAFPPWVKSVVLTVGCSLPVYPDERTYSESRRHVLNVP
jgi:hypothetical protein